MVRLTRSGWGYRDSLLETAQEAVTIAATRGHRWAQWMWQEKLFFERLYLVPGMGTFGPWVNCSYAPTTPTFHSTTISWFLCDFFFTNGPPFFWSSRFTKQSGRVPVPSSGSPPNRLCFFLGALFKETSAPCESANASIMRMQVQSLHQGQPTKKDESGYGSYIWEEPLRSVQLVQRFKDQYQKVSLKRAPRKK